MVLSDGRISSSLPPIKTLQQTIQEREDEFIDDPEVFVFQLQSGLIQSNSITVPPLPATSLFTSKEAPFKKDLKDVHFGRFGFVFLREFMYGDLVVEMFECLDIKVWGMGS